MSPIVKKLKERIKNLRENGNYPRKNKSPFLT